MKYIPFFFGLQPTTSNHIDCQKPFACLHLSLYPAALPNLSTQLQGGADYFRRILILVWSMHALSRINSLSALSLLHVWFIVLVGMNKIEPILFKSEVAWAIVDSLYAQSWKTKRFFRYACILSSSFSISSFSIIVASSSLLLLFNLISLLIYAIVAFSSYFCCSCCFYLCWTASTIFFCYCTFNDELCICWVPNFSIASLVWMNDWDGMRVILWSNCYLTNDNSHEE